MDILFLLIPLSVFVVLAIIAVFHWALQQGQFDDLEQQGRAILASEGPLLDQDQGIRSQPANNLSEPFQTESSWSPSQIR